MPLDGRRFRRRCRCCAAGLPLPVGAPVRGRLLIIELAGPAPRHSNRACTPSSGSQPGRLGLSLAITSAAAPRIRSIQAGQSLLRADFDKHRRRFGRQSADQLGVADRRGQLPRQVAADLRRLADHAVVDRADEFHLRRGDRRRRATLLPAAGWPTTAAACGRRRARPESSPAVPGPPKPWPVRPDRPACRRPRIDRERSDWRRTDPRPGSLGQLFDQFGRGIGGQHAGFAAGDRGFDPLAAGLRHAHGRLEIPSPGGIQGHELAVAVAQHQIGRMPRSVRAASTSESANSIETCVDPDVVSQPIVGRPGQLGKRRMAQPAASPRRFRPGPGRRPARFRPAAAACRRIASPGPERPTPPAAAWSAVWR